MPKRVLISGIIMIALLALTVADYAAESRHDRVIDEEATAVRVLQAVSDASGILERQRERVSASVYVPLSRDAMRAWTSEFQRLLSDHSLAIPAQERDLQRRILADQRAFSRAALALPASPSAAQVATVGDQAEGVAELLSLLHGQHRVNLSALLATENTQRALSFLILMLADGLGFVAILVGLVLLGRLSKREAEAQARQASEQLRAEFVAFAAHELRSPASAIKMGASLMQNPNLDPETRQQVVDSINRTADAMSHVVLSLLDLGRIEAGKLQLQRRVVSLPELAEELLAEVGSYHAGIERRVRGELPRVRVSADPDLIKLVISNLLDNAIKYSPPGSPVYVSGEEQQDNVVIRVRNLGAGIASELLPRIFDQWVTTGDGPRGARHGTGLGLYMARLLVEAHGGTIWAESTAGQGATISFTLPIAQEE
jgi:signal transduction histidine kinase